MRTLGVLACVLIGVLAAGCSDSDTVAPQQPSPVAAQVRLSAFPTYVVRSGSTATLTARVTASNGSNVANVPVTFATTAGTLSAASAITSDSGTATVTLEGGEAATVTADASGARSEIAVEGRAPYAIRLVTPSGTIFTDGATFQVAVDPNIAVVNPPSPSTVTLDCGTGNPATITDTRQRVCTFAAEGSYTVLATAVAANGWTVTDSRTVTATSRGGGGGTTPPSTATPSVTITAARIGFREYRFTATATVPVERFVFEFGDTNTATRVAEGNRMSGTEQHLYSATSNSNPAAATGVVYTVRVTAPPVDRRPEVSTTTTVTLE